ncbi:hypothetical protein O3M35_011962 [Rhynocoris fuscipes]
MVSKLNAVLLDRIKESSQNTNLTEQYAQDLWPDDTLIPQPILDYFSYIANTVCSTGESVVVNIPELAIPQGPIKVDDVEVCPSGSFGYVNANTHNVYECYASPLVTSRMVINEFRVAGQPELPPLPPYIAPAEPSTSSSTPPAGLITRYGRRVRFPARLLSVVTGEGRNVDWGESREYEEREGSKKGKPTARSQGHKAKRQQESRAKYLNRPDTDLKDYGAMTDASRETDAKDELDWEIGMLSASTPINATYCQNFDFSGFFTLIEQTYSSMLEVNPRIIKEMPFSVFQHSMVSKLNAVLLDRIKESSQNTNLTEQYAQDLWPDDTLIPQPILDYFSYIANTVCSTGESVVVNIPELAIPQGPIKVDDVEVCPSGSFGYVNANTHNVYECYASPLVTSRMVINEFRVAGQPELPPLPPYIAPAEPSTSSSTPPAGLITRYGRRVRFPARLLSVVTGEGVCGCG